MLYQDDTMTTDSQIKDTEILKPIEDDPDNVMVDFSAPYERSAISDDDIVDESAVLLEASKVPEEFITFASRVYDYLNKKYSKSSEVIRGITNGPINIRNRSHGINLKKSLRRMQYKFVVPTSTNYKDSETIIEDLKKHFKLEQIFKAEDSNIIGKMTNDKSYIHAITRVSVKADKTSFNKKTVANDHSITVVLTCYRVNKSILRRMEKGNNTEEETTTKKSVFSKKTSTKVEKKDNETPEVETSTEEKKEETTETPKEDKKEETTNESVYDKYLAGKFGSLSNVDILLEPVKEEKVYDKSIQLNNGYLKVLYENVDMSNRKIAKDLTYINEAEQNKVLMSLTSKLYSIIVDKANDIDFGEIPNTKGDITKLSNYNIMKESVSTLRDIIKEFKQDTKQIDILAEAISNIEARKETFEKAYRLGIEFPQLVYCTLVLSVINSVSYLIATCIEFIKTPSQDNYNIVLDTMRYKKSRDYLVHSNLEKMNKEFKNGNFDKLIDEMIKNKSKQGSVKEAALGLLALKAVIITAISLPMLILLISVLLPLIRELIFLLYHTSMKISDYFDLQANLLEINIYNLEINNPSKTTEEIDAIAAKQSKIVESFRKISNLFNIDSKKAESKANSSIEAAKSKLSKDDLVDADASLSSLF